MTLADSLCAHMNPVVAHRARRLLAGESERSPALYKLRRAIGSSEMARRLLMALRGERFNPYRKWQGPHWTLYSLAEIGVPAGDEQARRSASRAAELLPERRLLWRKRNGALIEPEWGGPVNEVHYPIRFYHVLSVLLAMAEIGMVRDRQCREALDLLEGKRLADGTFPVEWTNVTTADRVETRGTSADWGTMRRKTGNPFVTVDALYVLKEAGRTA